MGDPSVRFGIARRLADPRPRSVRGTEGYTAPEVCLLEEVTPAADIFGLGVTLYELLTGKMPFPDKKDDEPYPQTLQPPATVRKHRAAVPVGLEELILNCLSRDPTARPSLTALLPAFNRYIKRGPPMWPTGFDPEAPTADDAT